MALFEFFLAAAGARIIAADVFQGVAHGLLWCVAAIWAVDVSVLVIVVLMIVVVGAVRAVNVGFLVHQGLSGIIGANYLANTCPVHAFKPELSAILAPCAVGACPMNLYEIVFSGQIVPGALRERVEANLITLFHADEQRIALLFSGRRLVLKNNLDQAAAFKYRSTLERAGAIVEIVDMHLDMEEVELAPPPDAPGFFRPAQVNRRLQVAPRDAYMAAFVDVDAPNYSVAEVGSALQEPKAPAPAPRLDLSQMSLAPVGSDLHEIKKPPAGPAPDTSHLKLC